MTVHYGNFAVSKGKLIRTISQDEARDRYEAGIPDAALRPFKVIFGEDPGNPSVVVEVSSDRRVFTVQWLDDLNRCIGWNVFVPEDKDRGFRQDGRLFLEQTRWMEYADGDTQRPPLAQPHAGDGTWFAHDGSWYSTRKIGDDPPEEARGVMRPEDAARILWEPTPHFGAWDSLVRRER